MGTFRRSDQAPGGEIPPPRDTDQAVVVVLRRGGRVLVIERAPGVIYPGYWTPLSGRVREGETQAAAVQREVAEEVGLRARPVAKVWECDTEDGQFRLHWWLADADRGELRLASDEVRLAKWIRPAAFAELEPTFEDDRRFFTEILPRIFGARSRRDQPTRRQA